MFVHGLTFLQLRLSLAQVLFEGYPNYREWALAGMWSRQVHVIDGKTKYARGHVGDNAPLSMGSNRWSTRPINAVPGYRIPKPDGRAWLDCMP